eukprot:3088108-Rhodomonas_salina.2
MTSAPLRIFLPPSSPPFPSLSPAPPSSCSVLLTSSALSCTTASPCPLLPAHPSPSVLSLCLVLTFWSLASLSLSGVGGLGAADGGEQRRAARDAGAVRRGEAGVGEAQGQGGGLPGRRPRQHVAQ